MAGRLCMGSAIDLSILQAAVATVQPGGFKRCLRWIPYVKPPASLVLILGAAQKGTLWYIASPNVELVPTIKQISCTNNRGGTNVEYTSVLVWPSVANIPQLHPSLIRKWYLKYTHWRETAFLGNNEVKSCNFSVTTTSACNRCLQSEIRVSSGFTPGEKGKCGVLG